MELRAILLITIHHTEKQNNSYVGKDRSSKRSDTMALSANHGPRCIEAPGDGSFAEFRFAEFLLGVLLLLDEAIAKDQEHVAGREARTPTVISG